MAIRRLLPPLVALVLMGCGDEGTELGTGGSGGGVGGTGGDGAGGDMGLDCPEGRVALADGSCFAPGPGDACGPSFSLADDGGCEAVVVDEPCAPGTMALVGQTRCLPVAACGAGPWGNIPVTASTVYVDQSYTAPDADGSATKPFPTIAQGVASAEAGAVVAVAAGDYAEIVGIQSAPIQLWGRCPDLVSIGGDVVSVGVGDANAPGLVSGTEIHNVALTGPGLGVIVSGAEDVVLDRVWIHDTGDGGVLVGDQWGPASVTIRNSLLEATAEYGVIGLNVDLTVEDSEIRGTLEGVVVDGRAVAVEEGTLELTRVFIHDATAFGIGVLSGATASIQDTVVHDMVAVAAGLHGRGVDIGGGSSVIDGLIVERARDLGISIVASAVDLRRVTVRETSPQANDLTFGRGINAQADWDSSLSSDVTIEQSAFITNHEGGITINSSTATIDATLVRDTLPRQSDGFQGMGINVSKQDALSGGSLPPGVVDMSRSLVVDNHVAGVAIIGSDVIMSATRVAGSLPVQNQFGDGVLVMAGPFPGSLEVSDTQIEQSARAGIVNFGAVVALSGMWLDCNAVHLDGEFFDGDFVFDDGGGNRCGCDGEAVDCKVLSTNLQPPATPVP